MKETAKYNGPRLFVLEVSIINMTETKNSGKAVLLSNDQKDNADRIPKVPKEISINFTHLP